MSGAGTFAAGVGSLAGSDPVAASSATTIALQKPAAVFYDPLTKQFPVRSDGTMVAIHPVDQAAAFALTIPVGAIKSCPTLGHTFANLPPRSDPRFQRAAEDAAKLALSDLIKAGDVSFGSVTPRAAAAGTANAGRLELVITYANLRTSQVQPVSSYGY